MTYNFDPDRWYDNHRRLVEAQRERGELDGDAYQHALDELDARYEAMTRQLDKAFEVPRPDDGWPSDTRSRRTPPLPE